MRATTAFVGHDASFTSVTGRSPSLELVAAVDAHEGPVYLAGEGALYVTSVPSPVSVIKRLAVSDYRFPVPVDAVSTVPADLHMPNGMTMDAVGHLVVCEQGDLGTHARISRLDPITCERTTIADGWRGRGFN